MVEHVNLEESELYALGVLDGDARHAVEEHLRACEPCAHHIALAHQMVSLVGLTSAPARPSPSVRDKVMRRVRAAHAEHWVETKPVQIAELRVQPEPEKEPEPEPVVQPVQQAPDRRVLWLAVALTVLLAAGASAGFWVTHRAHQKQAAAVEQQTQQTQPGVAAPAAAVSGQTSAGQTNAGQANAGQANKETTGPNHATATAPAREQAATAATSEPETLTGALDTPQRIVTSAAPKSDAPPPPSLAMGADLGAGGAALPALPGSSAEPRVQEAAPSGPIRVAGGVAAARLLAPIQASYPDIARQSHIQGTVVVDAIISTTGRVRYSHVVSGPALLTGAALSAVQRARYRPFVVNGAAVEAETAITLNFTLN